MYMFRMKLIYNEINSAVSFKRKLLLYIFMAMLFNLSKTTFT